MRECIVAKRPNCIRVIGCSNQTGVIWFDSISSAARKTNHALGTVRRSIETGKTTKDGWSFKIAFIVADNQLVQTIKSPSDANLKALTLSFDEVEKLYQLMRNELIRAATHGSRIENYRDPLYDKLALLKGNCHDSHDEYEYWRDWLDKNRYDIEADR